jgi:hypothetical protein
MLYYIKLLMEPLSETHVHLENSRFKINKYDYKLLYNYNRQLTGNNAKYYHINYGMALKPIKKEFENLKEDEREHKFIIIPNTLLKYNDIIEKTHNIIKIVQNSDKLYEKWLPMQFVTLFLSRKKDIIQNNKQLKQNKSIIKHDSEPELDKKRKKVEFSDIIIL